VANLSVAGLDAQYSPCGAAMIRLTQVRGALIRGCRPPTAVDTFLKLDGETSRQVAIVGNDLGGVKNVAQVGPKASKKALWTSGNRTP